jgi:hypothetical protein
VFPHLSSTYIPFSAHPLKAKYVELMGKRWSKKSYETFSNDFGKGFENGMMEREKMDSRKKILKLRCFSPQNIDFPILFAETLGAFLFSSSLFSILFLSLSLFSMLRLFEDLGILMLNEEKSTLQKFLFR